MIRTFAGRHRRACDLGRRPGHQRPLGRHHPCQALADLLTLRGASAGISAGFGSRTGDANNVCRSLVCAAVIAGLTSRSPRPGLPARRGDRAVREPGDCCRRGPLTLTGTRDEAARGAGAGDRRVRLDGQEVETASGSMPSCRDTAWTSAAHHRSPPTASLHCLPAHYGRRSTSRCSTARARPCGIRPRTAARAEGAAGALAGSA